jgi:hypothetical protein
MSDRGRPEGAAPADQPRSTAQRRAGARKAETPAERSARLAEQLTFFRDCGYCGQCSELATRCICTTTDRCGCWRAHDGSLASRNRRAARNPSAGMDGLFAGDDAGPVVPGRKYRPGGRVGRIRLYPPTAAALPPEGKRPDAV